MSFVFNEAKKQIAIAGINFTSADLRVLLVMTNTTADTEVDTNTFAGFTTLDNFDGSGYTSTGIALASLAVNENAGANRAEFDAADITFTAIGAGTRSIQAAVLYKFITALSSSIPVAFIDTGGFPFAANGGDVTIQWNASGILNFT